MFFRASASAMQLASKRPRTQQNDDDLRFRRSECALTHILRRGEKREWSRSHPIIYDNPPPPHGRGRGTNKCGCPCRTGGWIGGRAAAPTPMQSARRGKGNRRQPRAEQSRAGSHHYQGLRCFWLGAAGTGVKSIARTVPSLIGGHTMRAPFVPCVLVNLFWYLVPFPPS
jgi:hypothetical protein